MRKRISSSDELHHPDQFLLLLLRCWIVSRAAGVSSSNRPIGRTKDISDQWKSVRCSTVFRRFDWTNTEVSMLRASADILVYSSSVDVSSSTCDHYDGDDASNSSTSPAEMLRLSCWILVARHFREMNSNSDKKRRRPRSNCAAVERRIRTRSSCSNNRPSPKETANERTNVESLFLLESSFSTLTVCLSCPKNVSASCSEKSPKKNC